MSRPTPETDAKVSPCIGFYSCATVPADFARKLERERDEAIRQRDETNKSSAFACNFYYEEKLKAERERDEAREKYTTLLTDNMLDVHKLYKAIELIKSLINQIERPAYGIDEAVSKMFLMEEAKKFANEMQQM